MSLKVPYFFPLESSLVYPGRTHISSSKRLLVYLDRSLLTPSHSDFMYPGRSKVSPYKISLVYHDCVSVFGFILEGHMLHLCRVLLCILAGNMLHPLRVLLCILAGHILPEFSEVSWQVTC